MMKHSTQIDTINFVYNEMTPAQSQKFMRDLERNESQFSYFSEIIDLMSQMDDAAMAPSKQSIDNILNYAQKTRKVVP